MKKKMSLLKFEIISTIFIVILGILLQFTYKWSNNNLFIGIFSTVNESTWEHLKLLFFPMLIITIIGSIYFKNTYSNYLCIKTKSIIVSFLFIIIFFYTYTGIIGNNIAIIDISSFFIAVFIAQYYAYKNVNDNSKCNNLLAIITLFILFLFFIFFTFFPPQIGLFKDPLTDTFGIQIKR